MVLMIRQLLAAMTGVINVCTVLVRPLAVAAACFACRTTLAQTLEFATYWGSGGANNRTVVVDHAGNIYMSGGTSHV